MVRKIVLVLGLAAILLPATTTQADDQIAGQFYGSGVHRYFSGDLRSAHADFTAAIQGGTDDPRPYYFRALTYSRLGRSSEAMADFAKGAELESADINGSYQVSKSLERVQGRSRLQLERYRVQARAVAFQRQEKQRRDRYAAAREFQRDRVQRASAARPVDEPAEQDTPPTIDPFAEQGPAAAAPSDPFEQEPAPAADTTDLQGAARNLTPPAPPANRGRAADPFGAPAVQPAVQAERAVDSADPFGAGAATTTTAPPTRAEAPAARTAPPPPAAESTTPTDPFGAPAASSPAADPFGAGAAPPTDAATPAEATTTPAGNAQPPAASDPFGAPAATTTDNADPFGPADPVTPPAGAPNTSASTPTAPPAATAAPANTAAAKSGATGGLFRSLGKAVGLDSARGAAEGMVKSLPIGRGAAGTRAMPSGAPPARVIDMAPPANATAPSDPFGAPPANNAAPADDPFNAPPAAQPADPFNAPPEEMKEEAPAADDPFKDDAVQPQTPGGRR
jgi:hypothetical protein